MSSIGGVNRGLGEWITGYTKQIGHVTLLQAELWDVFIGLEVAWFIGVERLQDTKFPQLTSFCNSEFISLINFK
ncbi:hypothetical protein V6N11_038246 [Hibiscus sabdariffa]|uniref:Uncharacterized protein n=1 Tax=Hibiscus sabdariffa TaxID=183260 RepID=A0ABR2SJE4_9ROSI